MSADEKRLALMWHAKDGMGPTAIGDRLRRSPSSISRLLSAPPDQNPTGRPRKLTKQQIDKLIAVVTEIKGGGVRMYCIFQIDSSCVY